MVILTETTDKLQIVLGGAITTNQLQCIASYRDITTTSYTAGRNVTNTNNTTDVDLVGSPGPSTQRVIDFIRVYNNDTVASVVTIKFNANGTEYILFKGQLQPKEAVEYAEKRGFRVFSPTGAIKEYLCLGINPTKSNMTTVILSANVINNNVTPNTIQDITGLAFPVFNGTRYWFRFCIEYSAAATTTGSLWTINGPATSELTYYSEWASGTGSNSVAYLSAYNSPIASNAGSAQTTGNIAIIEGFIRPSADGVVIGRFASEITNSAITALSGSVLHYKAIS